MRKQAVLMARQSKGVAFTDVIDDCLSKTAAAIGCLSIAVGQAFAFEPFLYLLGHYRRPFLRINFIIDLFLRR